MSSRQDGRKSSSFKYNNAVPVLSSFTPKTKVITSAKSNAQVIVNYDYAYTHKGKKIEIFKDEVLELIHQTNEHWWKCSRGSQTKGFYVPAQYVSVLHGNDCARSYGDSLSGSESRSASEENLVDRSEFKVKATLQTSKSIDSYQRSNKTSPALILKDITVSQPETDHSDSEVKERLQFGFGAPKTKLNDFQSELRSSLRRLKSLERKKLVAAGSLERIDTEHGKTYGKVSNLLKKGNDSSTSENKEPYWSQSLEELSKQIVFPGQSPGTSCETDDGGSQEDEEKPKFFNNPGFKGSAGGGISKVQSATAPDRPLFSTFSPRTDGNLPKPTPKPRGEDKTSTGVTRTIIKIGTGSQENLDFSEIEEVKDAWKNIDSSPGVGAPASLNSSSDKTGEALFLDVSNVSVGSENSLSANEDEIPDPSEGVLNRSLPNNWNEYKCTSTDRVFYYNSVTNGKSWKPPRLSKSESNNNSVFNIPPGWIQKVDEQSGAVSFVSKITGSEWLTSQDPSRRLYFYEKDSTKSSWVLPEADQTMPSTSQTTRSELRSSSAELSEPEEDTTFVSKRNPPVDRSLKIPRERQTRSMYFPPATAKGNSLPRDLVSVWTKGPLEVKYEGTLNWTKIFDKNKKTKKNWASSYAVLTETHLTFFKDKNYLNSNPIKPEFELDLRNVMETEWTQSRRSSRKNVFFISSGDTQVLCQANNDLDLNSWSNEIEERKTVLLDVAEHSTARRPSLLSASPPNVTEMEPRRKSTTKSTKFREAGQSLARLFHRRTSKDVLEKRGIYKDEPVFGCPLDKLTASEKTQVPKFVDKCISVIESKEENMKTDGLYRASGNLSQVQKIRLQVDQNNYNVIEEEEDVHVLAGSLKLFFREMKEPAIPVSLFPQFLKASHARKEDKLSEFKKLVKKLPPANFYTLKRLFEHLLRVAQYSEFNRMELQNVAIVFGPTLMWNGSECNNMVSDLMQQNYVVEFLLREFHALFG